MRLVTKNWTEFQHYKDRSPPWIKLHKGLLDDRQYQSLPIASRALAPMLWLLASESKDGSFDADHEELAFRLRTSVKDVAAGLGPLVAKGFFVPAQDASEPLAKRLQGADPEGEGETKGEEEGSGEPSHGDDSSPASPPVVCLPLVDGSEYPVTQIMVDEWALAYPAVDVVQQLREMRVWSNANPANRKTARGVNAFVVRWLGKEQDSGKGGRRAAPSGDIWAGAVN